MVVSQAVPQLIREPTNPPATGPHAAATCATADPRARRGRAAARVPADPADGGGRRGVVPPGHGESPGSPDRRPGDGGPVLRRVGMDALLEQQFDPLPGGLDLARGQPLRQLVGERPAGQFPLQPGQRLESPRRQLPAPPLPEHGTELVFLPEAHPVVTSVEPVRVDRQQVADLAVRVVDHGVEHGHVPEHLVVRPAGQGHQVHAGVRLDPQLAHARAERAVAVHGRRHQVPAGGPGHRVGGYLPAGQRAVWEIPQRPLPRDRLVHTGRLGRTVPDRAVQRGVRGDDQASFDFQFSLAEQFQRAGVVIRGLLGTARGTWPGQPASGGLFSHWRPGGHSGAGRCAPRCRVAGRRAGTAAAPGPGCAVPAGKRPGPRPR